MPVPDRKEVIVTVPESGGAARIAKAVDGLVAWLARHWLATFNTIVGVFFILPFVAPVLMNAGLTGPGHLIYMVYSPTCHQLPERSYFLFGPQSVYSTVQLESLGAIPAGTNLLQREMLRYEGSPEIGYKVAFCERDAAMYGTIFLAGLAFGIVRRHYLRRGRSIPKLPLWGYALFLLPMAVDGFTQLFGLRESDWLLRTITGVLFGIGTVWLAYPYIQDAMDDVLQGSRQTRAEISQPVDA
jgi:uncharacterized membrane protein